MCPFACLVRCRQTKPRELRLDGAYGLLYTRRERVWVRTSHSTSPPFRILGEKGRANTGELTSVQQRAQFEPGRLARSFCPDEEFPQSG